MKEVWPGLFVGGERDLQTFADMLARTKCTDYGVVQACKEPYHRQALGYTSRGAPKNHPEYLFAYRGNRLILNLVDTNRHQFIPGEIIDEAVQYTHAKLSAGSKVFVHCNLGVSRGPSIALAYLLEHTDFASGNETFDGIVGEFTKVYPGYHPNGIKEKVRERYETNS